MPCDLGVGVCVSRGDMSAGSQVDSGREVSWNGSMCTVSRLDAEPVAALAWEADPLGALNSLFCCKMAHNVVPQVKIVSGPFLPLCQLWFPLVRLHVSDLSKECALALKPSLAGIFVHVILLTKLIKHRLPLGPILVVHETLVVENFIVTQKVH